MNKADDNYGKIKKGEYFTFANGEYSDYCVRGLYKAKKGFNIMAESAEWKNKWRGVRNKETFQSHLNRSGIVDELDYKEFHEGSYGEHDPTMN